jgi:mannosyltransferase
VTGFARELAEAANGRGALERARGGAPLAILGLAVAAGIGFGLYDLGARSIWLDEATSIYVANVSWPRFVELVLDNKANMPLYFAFLHVWMGWADGEAAIRLLSVIFGVAALPLTYVVVRRFETPLFAASAALVLSLNAFLVRFEQEARSYSLALLFALLSTWLFLRAIERPTRGRWLLYGAVIGLGGYAHIFVLLMLPAHTAYLALVERDKARAALWSIPSLLAVGGPLFIASVVQAGSTLGWIRPLSPKQLAGTIQGLTGGTPLALWVTAAWLALFIFQALRSWRRGSVNHGHVLAACWLLVPFLVVVAASVVKPLLVPRYMTIILPALAMTVVMGWRALPSRWLQLAAAGAVLATSLPAIAASYGDEGGQPPWRHVVERVVAEGSPTDGLLFWHVSDWKPFAFYVTGLDLAADAPTSIHPNLAWTANPYQPIAGPHADLTGLACRFDRLWVMVRGSDKPLKGSVSPGSWRGQLRADFQLSDKYRFRALDAQLFRPLDGACVESSG